MPYVIKDTERTERRFLRRKDQFSFDWVEKKDATRYQTEDQAKIVARHRMMTRVEFVKVDK